MNKENIEEAAREYSSIWAGTPYHVDDILKRCQFESGFERGAEWRIDSVWHDASEIPDLGEEIIVELLGKIYDYGIYDIGDSIHPKAKWAYMKDLLPIKEE